MYLVVADAVTACPSLFWPTGAVNVTSTPDAIPVNVGSGWNVTSPVVGLIVYVPSPSTVTESTLAPVFGSINLAGYCALGFTGVALSVPAPAVNVGVFFCSLP